MALEVRLPKLSDEMTEATISRWLKAVGDSVDKGEPLVEVETEKVIVEVEAPRAGFIVEIRAEEQDVVPVDAVICLIGEAGEVVQPSSAAPGAEDQRAAAGASTPPASVPPSAQGSNVVQMIQRTPPAGPARASPAAAMGASPLARRVADGLGIDLAGVQGSGIGGKIVMADLQPFVDAMSGPPSDASTQSAPVEGAEATRPVPPPPSPAGVAATGPSEYEEAPLSGLRRTIARRMAEAKATIPHFYMTAEIDVSDALALRERLNQSFEEGRISVNDLMIKGTALALERVPSLNATYSDTGLRRYAGVHIGIATAIDDGLVTPVVRDCHLKSIGRIARETAELIEKARRRELSQADLQGGTFTISNLGMYPVAEFAAIINPPQVGILAIARPVERPTGDNGRIVLRRLLKATLSADHRAVDGVTGAKFLEAFREVLEQPERLML